MSNYLQNYLSVQDGELWHFKTISATDTKVVFFGETYQQVGKGVTNLERPYLIPNAEKFVARGIKLRFPQILTFNEVTGNKLNKFPVFVLKFYLAESELFNWHLAEAYPSLVVYQNQTATEGTLQTAKLNLFRVGEYNFAFGFTKGLEIEILKNVSFRVEITEIENVSTSLEVGVFIVGTFYRIITG